MATALEVDPLSVWWVGCSFLVLVIGALVAASTIRIELTSKGRGALQPPGGVHEIRSQVSGLVEEIFTESGAAVRNGEALVVINARASQAELRAAQERLSFIDERLAELMGEELVHREAELSSLRRQQDLLGDRLASEGRSLARMSERSAAYKSIRARGFADPGSERTAVEAEATAERGSIDARRELEVVNAQIEGLEREHRAELWNWRTRQQEAREQLAVATAVLEQGQVKAPVSGLVESLVVHPGQLVSPGTPIASIVPGGDPREIVAFLPEKDRAFLRVGATARVGVEQLPVGEFGRLTARVVRISEDLATPVEVVAALGPSAQLAGPHYVVELRLAEDQKQRSVSKFLRSRLLVDVQFSLRRRLLIALVFDPVRRWIE